VSPSYANACGFRLVPLTIPGILKDDLDDGGVRRFSGRRVGHRGRRLLRCIVAALEPSSVHRLAGRGFDLDLRSCLAEANATAGGDRLLLARAQAAFADKGTVAAVGVLDPPAAVALDEARVMTGNDFGPGTGDGELELRIATDAYFTGIEVECRASA
jgi:hypothetical protein